MKRLWIVAALAAATVWAQPKPDDQVQTIVSVKYVDPQAAINLLANFGVAARGDRQLKVISLTGRRAAVETAEAAIKQLDVPNAAQKDVDLTVYFIVGRDDAPANGAIPPELQGTVAALKQTFPYKNYDLLDALSLRSRAGSGASTTGQLGGSNLSNFSVGSVNLEGDGMIRLEKLRASVRQLQAGKSGESVYVDVSGVQTDVVDVKEGQKLVVGRSSMGGMRALFLVLIAKVAQ